MRIGFSGADGGEKRLMRKVADGVLRRLGQPDIFTMDVDVVDGGTIREYNRELRGADTVTDVLSFPFFERLDLPADRASFAACDFDRGKVALGNILICRERAEEQAAEYGHGYARELGFLLCHGMLHLLGFDHVEEKDEEIMTAHQRAVMRAAGLETDRERSDGKVV